MAQNATADDGRTEPDQSDVSDVTECARELIANALDVGDDAVVARDWPHKTHEVVVVTPDVITPDVDPYDPSGYYKANVINTVLQSRAPVELDSTNEGERKLTFRVVQYND